jgi:hypothetical protein
MMSRSQCLLKADHCEAMARASADVIDRRMLVGTADHWRTLAKTAWAGDGIAVQGPAQRRGSTTELLPRPPLRSTK